MHSKKGVTENFHGVIVEDPYRWLEDDHSEDTKKWTEEQDTRFNDFIQVSERETIRKRVESLINYKRCQPPFKRAGKYFIFNNSGLQDQPVFCMRDTADGADRVVIDPNTMSKDGTVEIANISVSEDAQFVAYGISEKGSDEQVIRIRSLDTLKDFDDEIRWCRFTGIAWTEDSKGFYYARFPKKGEVAEEDRFKTSMIYFHTLGTNQSNDVLIHESPGTEHKFYPYFTSDKKYLMLHMYEGCEAHNRMYYREQNSTGDFLPLFTDDDGEYNYVCNDDETFYFHTTCGAKNGKLIRIELSNPKVHTDIIPESSKTMSTAVCVQDRFFIVFMEHAHDVIEEYEKDGTFVQRVKLPPFGSVSAMNARRRDSEIFIQYTSFLHSPMVYRYDVNTGKMTDFFKEPVCFDARDYHVEQLFFTSKDNEKISMFVVKKKDLPMNGNNPCVLYGYGGFSVPLTPSFAVFGLAFIESGGVYAVANIRGGNEYGEAWHEAGMLHKKQNCFDDFCAAAEALVEKRYTSHEKIAIMGGSNGGLLVAACMTQRPELFGAVVCQVPLTDMLRFHKFTVGRYWICEYGNPDESPEDFKNIYAYSPYHNVKDGEKYPATLIMTADTDDRVVPGHARKFAARLQEKNGSKNPILIRTECKAGHGHGKPTSKRIEEITDILTFLRKVL